VRSKKQVRHPQLLSSNDLTYDGQNFTYSKIQLWVALDRALRLADKRNLPCPNRMEWLKVRDTIYEEIMVKGFNEETQVLSRRIFMAENRPSFNHLRVEMFLILLC
jgi:GH15 family glucan-1,4-alpha-glucosidase